MPRAESASEMPATIGRRRSACYAAAVGMRTLVAMVAVALLGIPIGLAVLKRQGGAEGAGVLIAGGLALLGVGIGLVAVVATRADWIGAADLLGRSRTARPETRLNQPRTLVRPLAYTVVMLTLGGAVAVLAALIVVGSTVALISPFLALADDQAVIGPFTVSTVPQSVLAASVGVGLLAGLLVVSPVVARAHASMALQVLTPPEQRLRHDLDQTAQSRTRLVRAFDVERRRIERDLHDGVQPQLMSVSMTLGLALAEMPEGAPGRDDVQRAQNQARTTLEDLRRFVRGIHPQVLIDHGLGAAVAELADTLVIPIRIEDRLGERLPSELETNLYFCVAELLTNVVKHSEASCAEVRLDEPHAGVAQLGVHDDGVGGAGAQYRDGGGLDGIADRIAAFDGALTIDSPVGGPTTITIALAIDEGGRAHA